MAKQITPTESVTLCDNYDAKHTYLTKLIKKEDNRSGYLSIKDLEDYLSYIKESNQEIDGIRIYLGSNDDTDLTTFFIAPTSNEKDNTTLNALNRFISGNPSNKKYTL